MALPPEGRDSDEVTRRPRSYHCVCSTFILATNYDMARIPMRGKPGLDSALIVPTQGGDVAASDEKHTIVQNLTADKHLTIIRREDGFEKRVLERCQRCNVVIGYRLDQAQFKDESIRSEDVLYIIPGAISATEAMMEEPLRSS